MYGILFLGYFTTLKNLHMNKKILAFLFAVPTLGLAQTTYKVMGFAPSLDQVAVESKDVTGHDVALAFTHSGGWYADAKDHEVGVSRNNTPQFRLVKTSSPNIYKLYNLKNKKFVAYTNANGGANKTKFVDQATDANTDWLIVQNIGGHGKANNFDIFPGSVSNPQNGTPAWNAFGGASESARIGFYQADDNGSCWSIEVATQELKFFSSYSESNDSYFMTIRGRYVHKHDDRFTADYNLEFGQRDYLFQLVGTPEHFKIYNAATGQPIGTTPGAGVNKGDNEDNNFYRPTQVSDFSVQSYGGRVYVKETRGESIYLNFRDSVLSTWHNEAAWTGRDEGSRILFTGEDGILAEAAKKLEAEIRANYPDSKFGNGLGQYPAKAKEGLNACLEGLKMTQDMSNTKIQEKKELYETALGFLQILALNMPKNGDLLYLSTVRGNNVKYLTSTLHTDAENGYDTYGSLGGHLTGKDQKSSDALFYYKEETYKEGDKTKVRTSLVSVATGRRVAWAQRTDGKYYPTVATKNGAGADFAISSREGKYVFEAEKRFLGSDANGSYAEVYDKYHSIFTGLRLERVTEKLPVEIGPSGYSSFWCPFEYTVPQGVTACRLEVVDGKVKLSPIDGNVPQNTAVFLKGDANAKVELTLVPGGNTPALTNNLLKGGAEPLHLEKPVYALKKDGGFVKVKDYVPAFKAYFTATENQVRELLERGLTGVVSVATEAEDAPVYDLSGRRVQQTTKGGVYVTNGKKFIAK